MLLGVTWNARSPKLSRKQHPKRSRRQRPKLSRKQSPNPKPSLKRRHQRQRPEGARDFVTGLVEALISKAMSDHSFILWKAKGVTDGKL